MLGWIGLLELFRLVLFVFGVGTGFTVGGLLFGYVYSCFGFY